MIRSRISERHYFLALALPAVILASVCFDKKPDERHTSKKKQNRVISCRPNTMKVGVAMFVDKRIETVDDKVGMNNGGSWLFTSSHPCPHRSTPGAALCMLAGHKRKYLKIHAFHTLDAEDFYS